MAKMEIIDILLLVCSIVYFFSTIYLFTGLFRLSNKKNSSKLKVSVVVAVHNEEDNLENCLNCLLKQDYPSDMFEVIIADDRSTDSTPSIIKRYCIEYDNFKSVSIQENETVIPKKTALIKALDIANGEVILSTDGDCTQSPGWISSMTSYFTDQIGLVIGHVGYFKPKNIWQGIDALDYLTHRALGAAFIGVKSVYTCTAANMAYKKEVFDNNRDKFKQLKVRPAEDNFILHCARNSGFRIAVATEPESIVETSGAMNFSHFLNQRFRWAAYGGNITTLGVKLFFIPALLFYVMIWVSLLVSVFSFSSIKWIFLIFSGKLVSDFLLIARYTHLYKIGYMLKYFVPLSIIHIVLAPLVAITGNLFPFTWKSRKYNKEHEISVKNEV